LKVHRSRILGNTLAARNKVFWRLAETLAKDPARQPLSKKFVPIREIRVKSLRSFGLSLFNN
jgi:hypothetical protein